MKLIINQFDELPKEVQQDIQDHVSGHTTNFIIEENLIECDICGRNTQTKKVSKHGGVINVCKNCDNNNVTLITYN